MSVSDLHPAVCIALSLAACLGTALGWSFAKVFWRVEPDQRPGEEHDGSVLFCRCVACVGGLFTACCCTLALTYGVAGLYPVLGVLYRWLVL